MKLFSSKALKKMERDAARGVWDCVDIRRVPAFAAWLTDSFHEWQGQSPDEGEALRLYRNGETVTVKWDGKRTSCGRHVMGLWHTFLCFSVD